MTFASIYPMYLEKVEKKGRTKEELHQVIKWLTSFDHKKLQELIKENATFEIFKSKLMGTNLAKAKYAPVSIRSAMLLKFWIQSVCSKSPTICILRIFSLIRLTLCHNGQKRPFKAQTCLLLLNKASNGQGVHTCIASSMAY
jgi:hypothetical protein